MVSDPRSFWSIAEERARREARATELRRRLEAQFEPREANPADVESLYAESLFRPDVDGQVRQSLGSVAALASHGFDEGDENWYFPLLAELETCSGDKEISLYRVLMYGIFLAARLANPARNLQVRFRRQVVWLVTRAALGPRSTGTLARQFEMSLRVACKRPLRGR